MGGLSVCCSSRKDLDALAEDEPTIPIRRSTYISMDRLVAQGGQDIPPELVNPYEYKIKRDFSLGAIRKLIEEAETNMEGFDSIKKTNKMEVFMRNGSDLKENCPYSKVFYFFDAQKYSEKSILYFLTDTESRPKWDMHIGEASVVSRVSEIMTVVHVGVKAPFPYTNRDFVEKRIYFKKDGAYYCYFSSTQDFVSPVRQKENGKPEFIRGDIIIGLQVLRRVGDRWRLFIAAQSDLKMKMVPETLVRVIFPKTQEKWHQNLMKAIDQHQRTKQLAASMSD